MFRSTMNRDCKDVIAFHPGDHLTVVQKMQLDLYEPPMSQVGTSFVVLVLKANSFYNNGDHGQK